MKKLLQYSTIAALLLPALLALSPAVFAEDAEDRDINDRNEINSDPVFWSIPPINKQWNTPPERDAWTIPSASRQWSNPMPPLQWTIPRTANDLMTP